MRRQQILAALVVAISVLSACLAPTPPPAAAPIATLAAASTAAPTTTPGPVPVELINASAPSGGYASDTIHLARDTTLKVNWTQDSQGLFALWVIYDGEANLADPSLNRILVENTTAPSTGSKQYQLPAGDWYLEVEDSQGPWTVVVADISP